MQFNSYDLDSLRCAIMQATTDGSRYAIGGYDVTDRATAYAIARADFNFDNLLAASTHLKAEMAVTGGGIGDSYFETMAEFRNILHWLVTVELHGYHTCTPEEAVLIIDGLIELFWQTDDHADLWISRS